MRNDVSTPPPADRPDGPAPRPTPAPRPVTTGTGAHSHVDRAHSLNRTSDRPATGPLYDQPEDRGGIDSTTLSIIIVSVVAIALFVVGWTVFRGF